MKLFCKIGLHLWKTKKEKHGVVDHPNKRKHDTINLEQIK